MCFFKMAEFVRYRRTKEQNSQVDQVKMQQQQDYRSVLEAQIQVKREKDEKIKQRERDIQRKELDELLEQNRKDASTRKQGRARDWGMHEANFGAAKNSTGLGFLAGYSDETSKPPQAHDSMNNQGNTGYHPSYPSQVGTSISTGASSFSSGPTSFSSGPSSFVDKRTSNMFDNRSHRNSPTIAARSPSPLSMIESTKEYNFESLSRATGDLGDLSQGETANFGMEENFEVKGLDDMAGLYEKLKNEQAQLKEQLSAQEQSISTLRAGTAGVYAGRRSGSAGLMHGRKRNGGTNVSRRGASAHSALRHVSYSSSNSRIPLYPGSRISTSHQDRSTYNKKDLVIEIPSQEQGGCLSSPSLSNNEDAIDSFVESQKSHKVNALDDQASPGNISTDRRSPIGPPKSPPIPTHRNRSPVDLGISKSPPVPAHRNRVRPSSSSSQRSTLSQHSNKYQNIRSPLARPSMQSNNEMNRGNHAVRAEPSIDGASLSPQIKGNNFGRGFTPIQASMESLDNTNKFVDDEQVKGVLSNLMGFGVQTPRSSIPLMTSDKFVSQEESYKILQNWGNNLA